MKRIRTQLSESSRGITSSKKVFNNIVLEGALEKKGMVGFSKVLNQEESEAIRQYSIHTNQEPRKYSDLTRISR